jgi:hypothetical protein
MSVEIWIVVTCIMTPCVKLGGLQLLGRIYCLIFYLKNGNSSETVVNQKMT